ncbi:alpha/beta hydrolase [Actinomycetospora endophytica]|uniref:Alpha/beta hydrolase n=1 Tax=Actinomycetospora endophytica TaxID=2291215 RepID=A0ABS8P8A3_9PSEU|nr:alpha/beta hydrolase [Actinomycetospora endophytica]MCD2194507.1 alpha/beta hydrolase [Actinomycetospora endophytica]
MWWNSLMGLGLEHVGRATIGVTGLRHRSVGRGEAIEHPGSGPAVLVGGFGETRPCLDPMAQWLTRLGYDVVPYTLGAGMGCSQRTAESLVRRVRTLADRTGEPVRLLGHSRGGQLARGVAALAPDAVSHLVTIGTPSSMAGPSLPMAAVLWGFAAAGSLGVPRLYGLGCLAGSCCAEYRAAVTAPWSPDLSFTSIYSRADAAVSWRACRIAGARNVEVPSGHVAQLTAASVQRAVAEAFALPAGAAAVVAA